MGSPLPPSPSSSSSSSILISQLYALSVLQQQSTSALTTGTHVRRTATTRTTSFRTNLSRSITNSDVLPTSEPESEKHFATDGCRYRCMCLLIFLLTLALIAIAFIAMASHLGVRFTSCNCPHGYERGPSSSSSSSPSSSSSCTCVDRNECLSGAGFHTCTGLNMQCINTMGSYVCRCRLGFTREKEQDFCVDINECNLYRPCNDSVSTCVNLPGRYYCECLVSQTNDEQCVPKNMCAETNDLCGPHSECVVSPSNGYNCRVTKHAHRKERVCVIECDRLPFSVFQAIRCTKMGNARK